MPLKKKKPKPRQIASSPPKKMTTDELCKHLACLAAFNLDGRPQQQMKVYEAIRRLQMMDDAAIRAGILPQF